jgi:PTH1 family peptidyl-tRNA hydrolase
VPADRWLVVGLGNPGTEYADTRHNVGADTVRTLARRERAELARNKRVRCQIAQLRLGDGTPLVLAVPTTYMNRSGDPAQSAVAWFKVPPERTIVVHDDLDLPVGGLKLKRGGGHAGHNGLKDLDRTLGTRDYLRVRVGIGRPPGRMPSKDYVLRRFPPADREIVDAGLEDAADAVVQLITEGLEPTQLRYHSR